MWCAVCVVCHLPFAILMVYSGRLKTCRYINTSDKHKVWNLGYRAVINSGEGGKVTYECY